MSGRPEIEIARHHGLPWAQPIGKRLEEWRAGRYVPEEPAENWKPPPQPISLDQYRKLKQRRRKR